MNPTNIFNCANINARTDAAIAAEPTDLPEVGDLIQKIESGAIRALSIRQPWCHHILYSGKDVENRDWPTKGRGWFLIHAGKAWDGGKPEDPEMCDAPRGGIVGAARIVDCVTEMDSRWFFGKYGFVLRDAFPLPLIPCKGALGFFKLDTDTRIACANAIHATPEQREQAWGGK